MTTETVPGTYLYELVLAGDTAPPAPAPTSMLNKTVRDLLNDPDISRVTIEMANHPDDAVNAWRTP